ncbi:MAG TPA: hypothetical protein VFA83_12980, partial [Acidimicrobiales bacterium]|nr:hypothetical protein [Acidimicrobiales bacterium]
MRVRLAVAALAALSTLGGLAAVAQPAAADGTLQWPHFVKIHVQNATATTRVIIDTNYAHIRWVSQPGVVADDYLVRIDQSGYIHSMDNKLTFWRQAAPGGADLVVRITEPAAPGQDSFSYGVGTMPMAPQGTSFAGPQGNAVADTQPYVPMFHLPMDFILNVGGICSPATFLQVELEWTNKVWRTPDGIQPGLYKIRVMPDASVVSLDGGTSFQPVTAQPWDWNHQVLGVMIARACDQVNNDGGDIAGYDRHDDGSFSHMTTWAQQPDGGYGWQPNNCGQSGVCNTGGPRESFDAGNYIVQTKYNPSLTPKSNGGGAPAPPTPAPATTPTTRATSKSTTRSAPRTTALPINPAPAPVTSAPVTSAPTTAPAITATSAAPDTTMTATPKDDVVAAPTKPAGTTRGMPGPLAWVALLVLAAAGAGS